MSMSQVDPQAAKTAIDNSAQNIRTGMTVDAFKKAFLDNLHYLQGKDKYFATPNDKYMALAYTVRDRMMHRWLKTLQTYFRSDARAVFYLSAEYLLGRQLSQNLMNSDCTEIARQALAECGINLDHLKEFEPEPGLGNGGLGRLVACFLDSLATMDIPSVGYGIRYEYGIFKQSFQDGRQIESPDEWLYSGNPWEFPHPEDIVEVKLGGHTENYTDERGHYRVRWVPDRTVLGVPYITLVPGAKTNTINTLRLWAAKASREFDFALFDSGDYARAVEGKTYSENISKVLYPNDNTPQGKQLRLEQQYFFVSCSLQDIIRLFIRQHDNWDLFPEKITIQLNDTHPNIGIAELMRLLIDEYYLTWDAAWNITRRTFATTQHTVLPEALEKWQISLFAKILPRHYEIICEINHRFLQEVRIKFPDEPERLDRMSLFEGDGDDKRIRMAYLACVGSYSINGVAQLQTDLLKTDVFPDFYDMWPEKFNNKTNGVTPRRFLKQSNFRLSELLTTTIGDSWLTNLDELKKLEPYAEDAEFRQTWQQIKFENKQDLTQTIYRLTGIQVDPNAMFDIQVKRIHEYKRQLLNALHVITLYNHFKDKPESTATPRVVIFGGKAAPGYHMAKLIIRLINSIAHVVNNDPDIGNKLKVVFLPNFNVSLGEIIYPAANLSEQISTAGKEASGTGNMKFAINGALTIGTLDGANIEIRDHVGPENFFLFGLNAEEVFAKQNEGYNPYSYYESNVELKRVIDRISSGFFSHGDTELFKPIVDSLLYHDAYFLLADYQSYIDCQMQVSEAFKDTDTWTRKSILNTARTGYFSSDRTIQEYCDDIWKIKPITVN